MVVILLQRQVKKEGEGNYLMHINLFYENIFFDTKNNEQRE